MCFVSVGRWLESHVFFLVMGRPLKIYGSSIPERISEGTRPPS